MVEHVKMRAAQILNRESHMATPPDDDASLLAAIGQHRDLEAFAKLLERYKHYSFNLAHRMLHDSEMAEDAVQETMLNVWLSARKFRPEADARSWIASIVVNKSLTLIRKQARRTRHEERVGTGQGGKQTASEEGPEKSEVVAVLRDQLDRLPDLERRLLLCRYGAGISHQKIAELFDISRSMVTVRLQLALERLRTSLAKAGVAAVGPALGSADLVEALSGGCEGPPELSARILARIASAASPPVNSPRAQAVPGRTAFWPPFAAGLALVLAASGALWWMRAAESPKQSASAQPTGPAAPTLAASPRAEDRPTAGPQKPLYAQWSFQEGPAADLPLFQGAWTWSRRNGKGSMEVLPPSDPSQAMVFLLPVHLRPKPHRIALTVSRNADSAAWDAFWIDRQQALFHETWKRPKVAADWNRLYAYLMGEYVILKVNTEYLNVHRYRKSYPSDRLALLLRGWRVYELEIAEIAAEDAMLARLSPQLEIERIRRQGGVKVSTDDQPLNWPQIPEQFK